MARRLGLALSGVRVLPGDDEWQGRPRVTAPVGPDAVLSGVGPKSGLSRLGTWNPGEGENVTPTPGTRCRLGSEPGRPRTVHGSTSRVVESPTTEPPPLRTPSSEILSGDSLSPQSPVSNLIHAEGGR